MSPMDERLLEQLPAFLLVFTLSGVLTLAVGMLADRLTRRWLK